MRVLIIFLVAFSFALVSTLPVDDESLNNPGYFLYEREDGLFQIENLTAPAEEVFATEDNIAFYISTQTNRHGVRVTESQIRQIPHLTGWNQRKATFIVIHGWTNDHQSPVNDVIKTAALRSHDINVVVVDWSPIAEKNYITAQRSVVKVGNYIATFLMGMERELGLNLNTVTIAGHSLGAHVSGNIGAALGGRVGRIVGLDPAGPLFSQKNINNRLDPTDARFVEVIHSNDGRLGFGIVMGHADFYPNGGKSQPGCGIDLTGSCAHSRAFAFFGESLNNNQFWARICDSQKDYTAGRCARNVASRMGGLPVSTITGEFFLTTNSGSPYARG